MTFIDTAGSIAPENDNPGLMALTAPPLPLGRAHARRLREVYRSAGGPCLAPVEIELLAAGLTE